MEYIFKLIHPSSLENKVKKRTWVTRGLRERGGS